MREIKFRAWDSEQEYMRDWDNLRMINYNLNWYRDNTKQKDRINDMWEDEHLALMQYTGLKDKKGKEIYEGDIVKINPPFVENPTKKGWYSPAIVKFERGGFIGDDGHYDDPDVNLNFVGIEVIGNIYENKGLVVNG